MSSLTALVASLVAHGNESSPRSANTSAGGSASAAENSSRSKANATAVLPVENDGLVHGTDVPAPQYRGAGPADSCAADIGSAGGIGENPCPARQCRCGVAAGKWPECAPDQQTPTPCFGPTRAHNRTDLTTPQQRKN